MERKEFYYLEIFLESVTLDANITEQFEKDFSMRSPLFVGIRFAADMRPMTIDSYQSSKVVLHKHKVERYEFVFNKGKSLLIALEPSKYLQLLLSSPVHITFTTIDESPLPSLKCFLGYAKFHLNLNLIRQCMLSEYVEASCAMKMVCPIFGNNEQTVGELSIVISLSCMGDSIITGIQQLKPQAYVHNKQMKPMKLRSTEHIERMNKIWHSKIKELPISVEDD